MICVLGDTHLDVIVSLAGPVQPGEDDAFVRILPSPAHVLIVVAGARNAAMSMVVRTFGVWSGRPSPIERAPALAQGGGG